MAYKHVMINPEERQAYDKLIGTCLCSGSEEKEANLGHLKLELSYVFKDFRKQLEVFKEKIAKEPIAVFIALWADMTRGDKVYGVERLKMMCDLIEKKLLPLVSLKDFSRLDFSSFLDAIRCFEKWTLGKREELVLLYISFASWLNKETFGSAPEIVDSDRVASQKRQVPFKVYVDILERLDLRERILAKIFYLGGSRALEGVLSLRIEDIDFKKRAIRFAQDVSYPSHLFEDIKRYIQDRKKGFLFIGKEGERIAHTTPFRALKKVVEDLKLDPEFTFKDLTK